ncbi:MAG: DUF4395 domain-containing protein [Candidatus Marinimicrobia bacterium]|nr:DUF4395 domain-containing protein [Candidatus Neomarinimicrobiota bacterium]MCF7828899.1 DUF4395 domain-containing protein [Candidatus Neomarinimicrobiota bacterium]MCF7879859.1 DUF4395 domain-containing protein [Candidatus Neomarinimicrobiota bacterium]
MNDTITADKPREFTIERDKPLEQPKSGKSNGQKKSSTIPRPLVQANRAFLDVTILAAFFIHPAILILPFLTGVSALAFRWHPVIKIGQRFLKKSPDEYRREDKADQRFNQWIATILIGLSLGAFSLGYQTLGYIFGGMVIAAASVALMGFCVGCYIRFKYMEWTYQN